MVWPHSSLTPPQEPMSTSTTSSFCTCQLAVVYFSCFVFSVSLVSLPLVSHVSQPLNLIFILSTFRADPQSLYLNTFPFPLNTIILLPLLLCPCLALDPSLEYRPLTRGVLPRPT